VESPVQESQTKPKRLTDAAVARALGVAPPTFCVWRKQGCPNSSIEAAQAWKAARKRKPLPSDSQRRFGNQNGKGNILERKIERLMPTKSKFAPKLSLELIEKVGECFLEGLTDEETGWVCDLSHETIRKWRQLAPIKKYETERKRLYINKIKDGKQRDWTRIAWWMERRWPLEYSRPEVAASIRNSTTTVTNQTLVISGEVAAELTARATSVRDQVKRLFENRVTPAAHSGLKIRQNSRFGNRMTEWTIIETVH
jgi:hypothetical protein